MNYVKSEEELNKHLHSHLLFMEASCKSYDEGFEDEAQRLSTSLRVLLYDNKKQTSLLKQLGIKRDLIFLTTVHPYLACNEVCYTGFLTLSITGGVGGKYEPNCLVKDNVCSQWMSFDDWWNEIIFDDKKHMLSRADIVLEVANTDGGSHVDSELNAEYSALTKMNSLGWLYEYENSSKTFDNNPAYAAIRQISFELITSIDWYNWYINYERKRVDEKFVIHHISGKDKYRDKRYLYHSRKDYTVFEGIKADMIDPIFLHKDVFKTTEKEYYLDKLKIGNGTVIERHVFL